MQTFLPYPDFAESARVLDYRRLGKQRVEAKQILMVLLGETKAWQNHPAVRMWRGHTQCLASYGAAICTEWISRGYKDTLWPYFVKLMGDDSGPCPAWLGNSDFHRSHQSNLVRKLPSHYRQHFPDVPDNLPYVWPT